MSEVPSIGMGRERGPGVQMGIYRTGGVYLRALPSILYKDAFFLDIVAAAALMTAMHTMVTSSDIDERFTGLMQSAGMALEGVRAVLDAPAWPASADQPG